MSFQHIVWQERANLTTAAHVAIVSGLLESWNRCRAKHTNPQEPDLVAGLVLEGTPLLWKLFQGILGPHQIAFSLFSVYCHQSPRVRYAGISKSYTEVGDLLLVHTHRKASGTYLRNALLYQAKMSSRQPYRVPTGEQHQLRLYTEWPEFEYYNSPPLSGQRRSVTPHAPHTGAQYLLIDNRPPSDPRSGFQLSVGTYPIGSCMADSYLYDHNHLAAEVVDFLLARSGRHFAGGPTTPPPDGWSQLVWDLIRTSLQKVFKRRRAGWENVPRGPHGETQALDGLFFAQAASDLATSTIREVLGDEGYHVLLRSQEGRHQNTRFLGVHTANEKESPERGISMVIFETAEIGEGEAEE